MAERVNPRENVGNPASGIVQSCIQVSDSGSVGRLKNRKRVHVRQIEHDIDCFRPKEFVEVADISRKRQILPNKTAIESIIPQKH
jgi:hypothetical protein